MRSYLEHLCPQFSLRLKWTQDGLDAQNPSTIPPTRSSLKPSENCGQSQDSLSVNWPNK